MEAAQGLAPARVQYPGLGRALPFLSEQILEAKTAVGLFPNNFLYVDLTDWLSKIAGTNGICQLVGGQNLILSEECKLFYV